MKIFGIGLNKTGTTTLGEALKTLGYDKHIGFDPKILEYYKFCDLKPIFDIADQNNNFEDWPWPLIFKDLYEKYESAKFILTKRKTPETWYESLCNHSRKIEPSDARKLIYGHYMPHDFKKEHIKFYNDHNREVTDFFKKNAPDKLLTVCWEDNDEWEKLCGFLDKDIPKDKFPHLNKTT